MTEPCPGCAEFEVLKERLDQVLSAGVKSLNLSWEGISATVYKGDANGDILRDVSGKRVTAETKVCPWLCDPSVGPWYPSFAQALERLAAKVYDCPTPEGSP